LGEALRRRREPCLGKSAFSLKQLEQGAIGEPQDFFTMSVALENLGGLTPCGILLWPQCLHLVSIKGRVRLR